MSSDKKNTTRKTANFDSKKSAKVPKSPDLSAIVHRIGHDIGNPLTSIISLSSIIERFSDPSSSTFMDPEKLNKYSASIVEEAWKISHLSESLVFLLTERKVTPSSCNLAEISARAIQRLESRSPELLRNVKVSVDIPDSYMAQAEHDRLLYVFSELIRNAARATEELETKFPVRVFAELQKDTVCVTVENKAAQSCSLKLEELLKPLVKATDKTNAAGLGLSAVLNTVGILGGTLALEEVVSGEDVFFRAILCFPQSAECRPEIEAESAPDTNESDIGDIVAIIVDDEVTVASAIGKILEMGLAPSRVKCHCLDGEKALELIDSGFAFDVMFCDINLAKMSGRHVYERLLNERPQDKNKFIFITGDQGRHETIAYLDSVGRPYLLKPFEPQDLIDLVCELVE